MMHMIPHFIVPSTSHQRTTSAIDRAPARRLVGVEQLARTSPTPATGSARAEPPRLDAQPAEILHRIAEVHELPVEHRPQALDVRRSRCRAGSRRARRTAADGGGRLAVEPAQRQLERRVRLAERVEHLAVVLDLIGRLDEPRDRSLDRSRGCVTSASAELSPADAAAAGSILVVAEDLARRWSRPRRRSTIMYEAPSWRDPSMPRRASRVGTPAAAGGAHRGDLDAPCRARRPRAGAAGSAADRRPRTATFRATRRPTTASGL